MKLEQDSRMIITATDLSVIELKMQRNSTSSFTDVQQP